jgi:hypothetical protein
LRCSTTAEPGGAPRRGCSGGTPPPSAAPSAARRPFLRRRGAGRWPLCFHLPARDGWEDGLCVDVTASESPRPLRI